MTCAFEPALRKNVGASLFASRIGRGHGIVDRAFTAAAEVVNRTLDSRLKVRVRCDH